MKFLFDHNLSPRLVRTLADLYPDSQHVFLLQMDQEDDRLIWDYAIQHDYTIEHPLLRSLEDAFGEW